MRGSNARIDRDRALNQCFGLQQFAEFIPGDPKHMQRVEVVGLLVEYRLIKSGGLGDPR